MPFQCTVVTPEQQVFDQTVTQAILPAHDGQIGILTNRSPLLVKIGLGTLRLDVQGGKSQSFFIDGGVAQMKDNRLTILTEEATPATDIDAEAARAEYAEAEARVATDNHARDDRTHAMRRARAKQELAGAK